MNVVSLPTGLPQKSGEPPQILDAEALNRVARALYKVGGYPRGQSTGWEPLDAFYTVLPGEVTVITGVPGSGKSEWLDALMVNLAEADDRWEFGLYSPEQWPVATHLIKLVEKHERKPFDQGHTTRMSATELDLGAIWVHEHFFWLAPDYHTPDFLIETGINVRRDGKKFGIVLDPWNTLDHVRGGMNETDYISNVLTKVVRLAHDSQAHIWLVVHPSKIQKNKDGTRSVPTPYDLHGSAHWYNKADNVITVHRRQADATQEVEIHVQKVKHKWCGRVGLATLRYDRLIGRYFHWPAPAVDGEFLADPERRS